MDCNSIFPRKPDWAAIAMAALMVIWLLLLLSSCGTYKQFVRFAEKHPGEAAEYLTATFPIVPDTIYKKGKDSMIYAGAANLPYIPGQPLVTSSFELPDTVTPSGLNLVILRRVDTLKISKESPAKDSIIAEYQRENAKLEGELEDTSRKLRNRSVIMWGSWGAGLLIFIIFLLIRYNGAAVITGILKRFKNP